MTLVCHMRVSQTLIREAVLPKTLPGNNYFNRKQKTELPSDFNRQLI